MLTHLDLKSSHCLFTEPRQVTRFIGSAVDVAVEVQKQSGPKLVDFRKVLAESPPGVMATSQLHLG